MGTETCYSIFLINTIYKTPHKSSIHFVNLIACFKIQETPSIGNTWYYIVLILFLTVTTFMNCKTVIPARGINMTVEEVAGLATSKYAEKVQQLHLTEDDLAFLKGLRRRIKNRVCYKQG